MNEKNEFKPYIPADRVMPELTVTSIVMGMLLAVIFGAANAYLGLRVGMTVSASIPAAVISMGVIRVIMKRNSILESNMVQTIGSAGESLAAGAIFTMPALFLWAEEGLCDMPSLVEITLIALCGGVLGVLFMVPLRNALIVKEHETLLYPEGTACADVLLAGEEGGANASTVFSGMGLAAAFKFVVDGLKVLPSDVAFAFKSFKGEVGMEVYPALLGVGYIVGPQIASYMFVGSVIGWMVIIPLICLFGPDTWLYPADVGKTIADLYAAGGAAKIWSTYVKYIGAGAIATGGIISLIKSLPLIITTFRDSIKSMKGGKNTNTARTAQDLPMQMILFGIVAMILIIWVVPAIPVTLLGAAIIVVFGFFFATVSSRMVGLVGSSNNPVSGMAIATLLIATMSIKASGKTGIDGMTAAIAIGSVICIVAAIAGDTSQDLKTGYLLGATPKKQQMGEIIGVVVSGLAIGGVLYLLNAAWGYGGAEVPAPQATLMKMIVEGIMGGNLPWNLVFIGVFLAIALEILRVPVMPFAIGLYLPIYLNASIMIGGVVRMFMDRRKNVDEETKTKQTTDGTLYCAGMIAGEGLVGILLAIFAVFGINVSIGESVNFGNIGGVVLMVIMILCLLKFSLWKKSKEK
ncbi:OPT family oligopeptide transporter [Dorea formicigenerans]|jgi:putative OPT family oligopeptide transporter|uniref:Oligopeptide transporter, OPT family n=1 Tax=Dorea formicigenerans TaxID=39486 RepID=A0A3E4ME43_9FIRM|nr:oligopeptide transporter, OPT family [Dorea formicigenerans]RGI84279.1 oligopeptide transporter, OPT family [Dorea formicigenerans]RGI87800.1 oligopeptide transporter, OPT family [Dorea formicigenerans]RGK47806.1 oligopeptide transporter, OPT family [Dorea formicigenerans]RGO51552.1 oligopeptide transporter, OPT family [Dorea formicigenerans]RGR60335.1 oligopeptide transporter, OPT family [Dorea formicigenerans]